MTELTPYDIRSSPGAGRGAFAIRQIPAGKLIHRSRPPICHQIFRTYRKETCAYCFFYDRGRTLAIRDAAVDKVFCSEHCQSKWSIEQGAAGIEAWRSIAVFVKTQKVRHSIDDSSKPRPDQATIDDQWSEARSKAELIIESRTQADTSGVPFSKPVSKKLRALLQECAGKADPDLLAYFLDGLLSFHRDKARWTEDILDLAMDTTPYRTPEDLSTHIHSCLKLIDLLPPPLLSGIEVNMFHLMTQADNHNAFGIRSGSDDNEEMMGYGVYPSASYFNHSCDPNVSKRRHGREWEFKAARMIEAGEECCITYLGGDEEDMTVKQRREKLEGSWGFVCGCAACVRESSGGHT